MEGKRHRRGIICKMMLLLTPMVMPAKERESKMRADRRTRTEARNDDRAGKTAVSGIQSSDDCLFLPLFLSWRGGGGGNENGDGGGKVSRAEKQEGGQWSQTRTPPSPWPSPHPGILITYQYVFCIASGSTTSRGPARRGGDTGGCRRRTFWTLLEMKSR